MSVPVYFAPLQGYTHDAYRRIHHSLVGGVAAYYTPFVRIEAGSIRPKDLRDVSPEHNEGVPVVPQIIVKSLDEFNILTSALEERGYTTIDVNMGCPFPMQAKHGRGCGLLAHLSVVESLAQAMMAKKQLTFSVKMRPGWESPEEGIQVLQILNDVPLQQLTVHPRLGIQQYKGEPSWDVFTRFYEECRVPLVYNGDLCTVNQIKEVLAAFPRLSGVMIGRGLLARPSLAVEYAEDKEWSEQQRIALLLQMHEHLRMHYAGIVNSDAQLHERLRTFWEYTESEIGRKAYKKIRKSGNLKNYLQAVLALQNG